MARRKRASVVAFQDRVKEFRRIPASALKANPKNWRIHPAKQRKVWDEVKARVGFAGAVVAYETEDGLVVIDGHMRLKSSELDDKIPTLILDVDEAEADLLLATYDPIGEMTKKNEKALNDLTTELDNLLGSSELMTLCGVVGDNRTDYVEQIEKDVKLVNVDVNPPRMAWLLIGVPVSRWDEVAPMAEAVAEIDNSIVEASTNEKKD